MTDKNRFSGLMVPVLVGAMLLAGAGTAGAQRLSLSALKNQIDAVEADVAGITALSDLACTVEGDIAVMSDGQWVCTVAVGPQGIQGEQGLQGTAGADGADGVDGLAAYIATAPPTVFDDMNSPYSVGTIWVDIVQKVAYILVDGTGGAAVWERISAPPPPPPPSSYAIGDTGPAGGIVIHVTDGGIHGLEVAPAGSAVSQWGCFREQVGAFRNAIGTGTQNTADIVAAGCGSGSAAAVADDYSLNGIDDWFLPSKDELDIWFRYQSLFGGNGHGFHWSSSEVGVSVAWVQDVTPGPFGGGTQVDALKRDFYGVRAVRDF